MGSEDDLINSPDPAVGADAPSGFPPPPGYPVPPGYPPPGMPGPPSRPGAPALGTLPPPPGWPGAALAGSAPGTGRFRGQGVGELLDSAFSLYRRNFLLIVAIAAVVQVPYAVVRYLLTSSQSAAAFANALPRPGQVFTGGDLTSLADNFGGYLGAMALLGAVFTFIISPLAVAATTIVVSDRYLGQPTSLGRAYRAAFSRLGALAIMGVALIAMLVASAIIGVGVFLAAAGGLSAPVAIITLIVLFLACIVYIAILYVRLVLAAPAIVLEKVSGLDGLRRSNALVAGSWWRVAGVLALISVLSGILGAILGSVFATFGSRLGPDGVIVFNDVVSVLVNVFIAPLFYITQALLYYDLRIRKEGFDIEMLSASL